MDVDVCNIPQTALLIRVMLDAVAAAAVAGGDGDDGKSWKGRLAQIFLLPMLISVFLSGKSPRADVQATKRKTHYLAERTQWQCTLANEDQSRREYPQGPDWHVHFGASSAPCCALSRRSISRGRWQLLTRPIQQISCTKLPLKHGEITSSAVKARKPNPPPDATTRRPARRMTILCRSRHQRFAHQKDHCHDTLPIRTSSVPFGY